MSLPLPQAAVLASLPGVWRADAWAGATPGPGVPSGHAALDAELPGGGWPTDELIELLQPAGTQHEWRLLLPVLRFAEQGTQPPSPPTTLRTASPSTRSRPQARTQGAAPLVLVGAPHLPHLGALAALGVAPERLLRIDTPDHAERLWAAEQVLRSGTAGALLVWLPQARPEQLRRLHLAARAASGGAAAGAAGQAATLLFALRPEATRQQASPAPLRLLLRSAGWEGGLQVQVFKRRGLPMDQPITLAAELPLAACLRRVTVTPQPQPTTLPTPLPDHVVDRSLARPARRPARMPGVLA